MFISYSIIYAFGSQKKRHDLKFNQNIMRLIHIINTHCIHILHSLILMCMNYCRQGKKKKKKVHIFNCLNVRQTTESLRAMIFQKEIEVVNHSFYYKYCKSHLLVIQHINEIKVDGKKPLFSIIKWMDGWIYRKKSRQIIFWIWTLSISQLMSIIKQHFTIYFISLMDWKHVSII